MRRRSEPLIVRGHVPVTSVNAPLDALRHLKRFEHRRNKASRERDGQPIDALVFAVEE